MKYIIYLILSLMLFIFPMLMDGYSDSAILITLASIGGGLTGYFTGSILGNIFKNYNERNNY